jgi:small subunit ribosomal protein S3
MGQKVSPTSFRLGVINTWNSRWFSGAKKYRNYFLQDIELKKIISKKLRNAGVAACEIERGPQNIKFTIFSSRPGVIIGRAGSGIEELKKEITKRISKNIKVEININEIKNPEENAVLVAQMIAEQIEKRIPYRRAIKKAIDRSIQSRGVHGVKAMVAGRLDGTEIAREEWLSRGKIPLQTLRANIDFAKAEAYTTYGTVGIKVWIYKGEVFGEKPKTSNVGL